ncbi:mCG1036068 [Mus musculus]|nr:mCG1036068 [Mus musculus]
MEPASLCFPQRVSHSSHIVCNIYDPAPWSSLRASGAGGAEPAGIEKGAILQRSVEGEATRLQEAGVNQHLLYTELGSNRLPERTATLLLGAPP